VPAGSVAAQKPLVFFRRETEIWGSPLTFQSCCLCDPFLYTCPLSAHALRGGGGHHGHERQRQPPPAFMTASRLLIYYFDLQAHRQDWWRGREISRFESMVCTRCLEHFHGFGQVRAHQTRELVPQQARIIRTVLNQWLVKQGGKASTDGGGG
jgi:hypothetical protein